MEKEYIHANNCRGSGHTLDRAVRLKFKYTGKELLVLQCTLDNGVPYVVIPGWIKKAKAKKTPQGLDITIVSLTHKKQRDEIRHFVEAKGFKGHINFWDS